MADAGDTLTSLGEAVIRELKAAGKTLAAAESCTAGLVADALASVPGASEVFWGSFVSYTPEAKMRMLGVGEETLSLHGTVSSETAIAMAAGALEKSGADYAVSVTGLAGPDGAGSETPVGTVWIALAGKAAPESSRAGKIFFYGSRNEIRRGAAMNVLRELLGFLAETLDCP